MNAIREAIAEKSIGDTLWLYTNYHCNLACAYCLTDSLPTSKRRTLPKAEMLDMAKEASDLGFARIGLTGGEPLLRPDMPAFLREASEFIPILILTNGTLFTPRLLKALGGLEGERVAFQLSVDSATAGWHDRLRGAGCFDKAWEAVETLVHRGFRVRLATTGGEEDPDSRSLLCERHKALGIPDEDHVVRPIVRRGRSTKDDDAVVTTQQNLSPELTLTQDGAFWSPFGPTVREGVLDTDFLISRRIRPLPRVAEDFLALVKAGPPGADTTEGIP